MERSCPQALARLHELVLELEDDRVARAAVAVQMGLLLGMVGRFDEAREHVGRSTEIFVDLGQRKWQADAAWKSGLIARFDGRLDDAKRHLRESYRSFQEQRDGANAPPTACDLAQVLCDLEEYGEAMELSEFARSQAVSHDLESQVGWRCVRARTLAGRGRFDEAEPLARQALELVTPTDFLVLHGDALVDLGEVMLAAGRKEEGTDAIAGAIERYERKGALTAQRRASGVLARRTESGPQL